MYITKQNLIDIGIREDKIIVFNVPICTLNKTVMVAKLHIYKTLEDLKKEDFIKAVVDGAGFIFICHNDHNKETDDEYILRIYE